MNEYEVPGKNRSKIILEQKTLCSIEVVIQVQGKNAKHPIEVIVL